MNPNDLDRMLMAYQSQPQPNKKPRERSATAQGIATLLSALKGGTVGVAKAIMHVRPNHNVSYVP